MGKGRKCRCKCKVSSKARIRNKNEQPKDTIQKAPAKVYRDTGANFKIKIRRK